MSSVIRKKEQPLVRMDAADKEVLDEMTAQTGESAPRILHKALRSFRKQLFFEQMNAAAAALRNDPEVWAEEQKERALWDSAATDGLQT